MGYHFAFVNREAERRMLFDGIIAQYQLWKHSPLEPPPDLPKELKFVTVIGTSGIGKTTFLRRSVLLLAQGERSEIVVWLMPN